MTRIPAGQGRGHRVRLPDGLLQSREHPSSAKVLYAVLDLLAPGRSRVTGDGTAPNVRQVHPSQDWLAPRVALSRSTTQAGLARLARSYHGDGLGRRHPAYVVPTGRYARRGGGTLTVRTVTVCDTYTEVPAWSTGDDSGPLVDPTAWPLYVAATKHRDAAGVCRLPAGQLAEVIGVRRQGVAALLERLRHAGLVVTVTAPRKPTLILPLMVPIEQVAARAALADAVAEAYGYLPAGWRRTWSCNGADHGPVTGPDHGPATGLSSETQLLQTHLGDTARGGPPDPPLLADPFPATAAPLETGHRWRDPPPALYRHIRAQIAATSAARRAADADHGQACRCRSCTTTAARQAAVHRAVLHRAGLAETG